MGWDWISRELHTGKYIVSYISSNFEHVILEHFLDSISNFISLPPLNTMSDPYYTNKEIYPGSTAVDHNATIHNGGFPHTAIGNGTSPDDAYTTQRNNQVSSQMKHYINGHEEKEPISHFEAIAADPARSKSVYSQSGRRLSEWEAMQIANAGDFETIDAEIDELEAELGQRNRSSRWYHYELQFKDPRYFTWLLVGFASMGGLLSGIDQSLISGANLYMPSSLNLDTKQVSMVSSGVPLGAVGGALLLGPVNETFGRKNAIIISLILYTIGAALEAGSISYGMMVAARVILGLAVGLEGGTVPVYVAESVSRK